mgnify:CR=1 FL=1
MTGDVVVGGGSYMLDSELIPVGPHWGGGGRGLVLGAVGAAPLPSTHPSWLGHPTHG